MPSEKRKKISVITTTFNLIKGKRKDVFVEMFRSVHSQTYPNIEHLIIDGGSKDGTIEFINEVNQKYGKKQLVVFSEPDKGITDATNKGFRKSTGDYVILMPSDDYYMCDEALELLADALESKNADFACADGWWLFKDRWIADLESFVYRHPFMISTMLAKKELFLKYGFFDPDIAIAADYDLMFRILMQPEVKGVIVEKMLTVLRPGGASQQADKTYIKEINNIYKKYFSPKCHLNNKDCKNLHWLYPTRKLFNNIYMNETNYNILNSVRKLQAYSVLLNWKKMKKLVQNIMFLKFLFRPIKEFLGISKNSYSQNKTSKNIHLATPPPTTRLHSRGITRIERNWFTLEYKQNYSKKPN